jgi:hypothetical protein
MATILLKKKNITLHCPGIKKFKNPSTTGLAARF